MGNMRKTANGSFVDIDTLRLGNESVIAVGNLKVNARGDQLGPGGVPVASKQQVVNEYYNLHTPVVGAKPTNPAPKRAAPAMPVTEAPAAPVTASVDAPEVDDVDAHVAQAMQEPIVATPRPVRGSLASTVVKK